MLKTIFFYKDTGYIYMIASDEQDMSAVDDVLKNEIDYIIDDSDTIPHRQSYLYKIINEEIIKKTEEELNTTIKPTELTLEQQEIEDLKIKVEELSKSLDLLTKNG